jgi:hypothetical protein
MFVRPARKEALPEGIAREFNHLEKERTYWQGDGLWNYKVFAEI